MLSSYKLPKSAYLTNNFQSISTQNQSIVNENYYNDETMAQSNGFNIQKDFGGPEHGITVEDHQHSEPKLTDIKISPTSQNFDFPQDQEGQPMLQMVERRLNEYNKRRNGCKSRRRTPLSTLSAASSAQANQPARRRCNSNTSGRSATRSNRSPIDGR